MDIEKIVASDSTNLYLNSAIKLGLQYEVIDPDISLVRIFNEDKEILIRWGITSLNHSIGGNLAKSKRISSMLMAKNNIAVAKFESFTDQDEALKYLADVKGKVVVKPVSASVARGVFINPDNDEEKKFAVENAYANDKSVTPEIMIEEYVLGKDYRITVYKEHILAISERVPAYVIGNGTDSISKLIEDKNSDRTQKNLKPIKLEDADHAYLKQNDRSLEDIPSDGERVRLALPCNLGKGGESVRVNIEEVPEENLQLFRDAIKSLYLNFGGIDFISDDIRKKFTKVKSVVNEIGSAPQQMTHYTDSTPPKNYATIKLLKHYFNLSSDA